MDRRFVFVGGWTPPAQRPLFIERRNAPSPPAELHMKESRPTLRSIALAPVAALLVFGVVGARSFATPGITFKIRTELKNRGNLEKSKPDSVRAARNAAAAAARTDDIAVGDAG